MSEHPDNHEAVDSIPERIAKLEGRLDTADKSWTATIGQWMALLALIVSITVGGFQVYENIVLKQREERAADRRTLADHIRRITELNSRITSTYFSTKDDWATQSLAKTLNAEKVSILRLADDLVSKRSDMTNFAISFTLSVEHFQLGNTGRAQEYAKQALSSAATDAERVEAQRIVAQTLFAPGKGQDVRAARAMFGRALDSVRRMETFLKSGLLANVYTDWILSEAAFGDCERAKASWDDFRKAVQGEYNDARTVKVTRMQLNAMLGAPARCPTF